MSKAKAKGGAEEGTEDAVLRYRVGGGGCWRIGHLWVQNRRHGRGISGVRRREAAEKSLGCGETGAVTRRAV